MDHDKRGQLGAELTARGVPAAMHDAVCAAIDEVWRETAPAQRITESVQATRKSIPQCKGTVLVELHDGAGVIGRFLERRCGHTCEIVSLSAP
jgi:hypothetical protein